VPGSFAALSRSRARLIRHREEGFKGAFDRFELVPLSPFRKYRIQQSGKAVNRQEPLLDIPCQEVWRELTNYMEGDVTAEMRERIAEHLRTCAHCRAVYVGSKNVVQLLGNGKAFELPSGFSRRLYDRLQAELKSGLAPSSLE
jgi:Putative zinc-finger